MEIQDQITSEIDFNVDDDDDDGGGGGVCDMLRNNANYTNLMEIGLNTMRYNIGNRCTNGCEDNSNTFSVNGEGMRTCDWAVLLKPGENGGVPGRCDAHPEVAENCPDTCGTCCKDSTGKTMKKGKIRNCAKGSKSVKGSKSAKGFKSAKGSYQIRKLRGFTNA